jgi:transcriptional regulator with XRE-family HTH domain
MAKAASKRARRPFRATKGKSNPIDAHVGSRVRQRRMLLGMSQDMLGKAVGLTFQQIQKYERGINRIGASRLYSLSRVLNVPVAFFFEDMPKAMAAAGAKAHGFSEGAASFEADPMATRETAELLRAYYKIGEVGKRRKVLELLRSMSDG